LILALEPLDRLGQAVFKGNLGLPLEQARAFERKAAGGQPIARAIDVQ